LGIIAKNALFIPMRGKRGKYNSKTLVRGGGRKRYVFVLKDVFASKRRELGRSRKKKGFSHAGGKKRYVHPAEGKEERDMNLILPRYSLLLPSDRKNKGRTAEPDLQVV